MKIAQKIFIVVFLIAIGSAIKQNKYSVIMGKMKNNFNHSTIPNNNADEPPFIIHYGLNDSHSRSWVQKNSDGIIGISYFERFEGSPDEGILLYKTILTDGSENTESIVEGRRLEKSVLLYDSLNQPHIFVARSDTIDQIIVHHFKNNNFQWQQETIIHFYNEGGKFIYELSAAKAPDHSFHFLILKTRSDVDSEDFLYANIDSHLFHLSNESGNWEKELLYIYDTAYAYDMCMKSSIRQDIKVDSDGYIHITFSEQLSEPYDGSRLWYATNKSGNWKREIALNYTPGTVDEAGWFPSLCLDNNGTPHITCDYLKTVLTYSVTSCKLLQLNRIGDNEWESEVIATTNDGYYGNDGRNFTGALCHLIYDINNVPHVVFSDIAATHWDYQRMNVGNIRYGIFSDGNWELSTIYRQPLPAGFFNATEMLGMCLVIPEEVETIRVVGQEIVITGENQYSCNLINLKISESSNPIPTIKPDNFDLKQNFPNPFNPSTTIGYQIPTSSFVTIKVFDVLGNEITTLVNLEKPAGEYEVDFDGNDLSSGIYFYQLKVGELVETMKMVLMR